MVGLVASHLTSKQLGGVVVAEGRRDVIGEVVEVTTINLASVVDRRDELNGQPLEQTVFVPWVVQVRLAGAVQK